MNVGGVGWRFAIRPRWMMKRADGTSLFIRKAGMVILGAHNDCRCKILVSPSRFIGRSFRSLSRLFAAHSEYPSLAGAQNNTLVLNGISISMRQKFLLFSQKCFQCPCMCPLTHCTVRAHLPQMSSCCFLRCLEVARKGCDHELWSDMKECSMWSDRHM